MKNREGAGRVHIHCSLLTMGCSGQPLQIPIKTDGTFNCELKQTPFPFILSEYLIIAMGKETKTAICRASPLSELFIRVHSLCYLKSSGQMITAVGRPPGSGSWFLDESVTATVLLWNLQRHHHLITDRATWLTSHAMGRNAPNIYAYLWCMHRTNSTEEHATQSGAHTERKE